LSVVLKRAGKRVKVRYYAKGDFPLSHRVTLVEGFEWVSKTFEVEVLT
jgi:hypothetical protein